MNINLPDRVDLTKMILSKPCSPIPPPTYYSSRSIQKPQITNQQNIVPNISHQYQQPIQYNTLLTSQQLPPARIKSVIPTNQYPKYPHQYGYQPAQQIVSPYAQQPIYAQNQHIYWSNSIRPSMNIIYDGNNRSQSPNRQFILNQKLIRGSVNEKPVSPRPSSPRIEFKYSSPPKNSRNLSEIRQISNSSGFHRNSFQQDQILYQSHKNTQDNLQQPHQHEIQNNRNSLQNDQQQKQHYQESPASPMQKITQMYQIESENKLLNNTLSQKSDEKKEKQQKEEERVTNSWKVQNRDQGTISNYIYVVENNDEQRKQVISEIESAPKVIVNQISYQSHISNSSSKEEDQHHNQQKQTISTQNMKLNKQTSTPKLEHQESPSPLTLGEALQKQTQMNSEQKEETIKSLQKQYKNLKSISIKQNNVKNYNDNDNENSNSNSNNNDVHDQGAYLNVKYGGYGNFPRVQANSSIDNSAEGENQDGSRRYSHGLGHGLWGAVSEQDRRLSLAQQNKKLIKQAKEYSIQSAQQKGRKSQTLPQVYRQTHKYKQKYEQKYSNRIDSNNDDKDEDTTQTEIQIKLKQKELEVKNLKNQIWLMKLRENQLLLTIQKLQDINHEQEGIIGRLTHGRS